MEKTNKKYKTKKNNILSYLLKTLINAKIPSVHSIMDSDFPKLIEFTIT